MAANSNLALILGHLYMQVLISLVLVTTLELILEPCYSNYTLLICKRASLRERGRGVEQTSLESGTKCNAEIELFGRAVKNEKLRRLGKPLAWRFPGAPGGNARPRRGTVPKLGEIATINMRSNLQLA